MLILPRPRTVQPLGAIGPDLDNPLNKDLLVLGNYSPLQPSGRANLGGKGAASPHASVARAVSSRGVGMRFTRVDYDANFITFSDMPVAVSARSTFFILARHHGTGDNGQQLYASTLGKSPSGAAIVRYSDTTLVTTSNTVAQGDLFALVGVRTSATEYMCVLNGVVTKAAPGDWGWPSSIAVIGGESGWGACDIDAYMYGHVDRAWTEAECISWCQNPWQLFAPRKRVYFAATAGTIAEPLPDDGEAPSAYKEIVRDLIARARSELAFALDSPPSLYASAAQSVAVAQASETDTAQAVGKAKVKAVGQAVETDTSIAITARKSKNLAQATETDTAQAVARAKSKSIAQSTETDTAQAIARLKTKQVAQATETDLAQPITRSGAKNIAVIQATELDTAQPIARSKAKTFAQAFETDSAISVTRLKSRVLGIASETDTAQVVAKTKVKAIGQAAEAETALAITRLKRQTLQQATELDLAQAVTHTKAKGVAQAVETDTALSITQFGVVSGYLRGTIKVYPTLGVGSINVTPSISGTINVN